MSESRDEQIMDDLVRKAEAALRKVRPESAVGWWLYHGEGKIIAELIHRLRDK